MQTSKSIASATNQTARMSLPYINVKQQSRGEKQSRMPAFAGLAAPLDRGDLQGVAPSVSGYLRDSPDPVNGQCRKNFARPAFILP